MFDEVHRKGGVDPREAIVGLRSALDAVAAADWSTVDAPTMPLVIAELETQQRRVQALASDVVTTIDRRGLHRLDGHASGKVMVRHCAQLSAAEASARNRVAKVMTDLPEFAEAYRAGRVGTPQVRRLARVRGNPRVRDQLPAFEHTLLRNAMTLEYPDFDALMTQWERYADVDGAEPVAWRRRTATLVQHKDLGWTLTARLGSVDGAQVKDILDHVTAVERLADVEAARADHGEAFHDHLPRTGSQQRADAVARIFRLAAGAPPGTTEAKVTTDICIDHRSFETILSLLAGADVDAIDPLDERTRCSTMAGVVVDPAETVASALLGHVRRVVYDGQGTVIDLGRRRRLFTGSARTAALLQHLRCRWLGCWVDVGACEVDHLEPARAGGTTDPDNGAPMCGRHNRLKEHGYRISRDVDGTWHARRPDGTEIPDHVLADPYGVHTFDTS